MLHRKYKQWFGAALCVCQMQQASANINESTVLSEQPESVLEKNVDKPIEQPPAVPKQTRAEQKKLEKLADQIAIKHNLNPYLFRALITHESRWDTSAVSPQNAIGLTQVQPATAEEICGLESQELFDAEKNLECGAYYFSDLLENFGSVELALCAYNAGPNRVKRAGKCPSDYSVTQEYVKTVTNTWRETLWQNVWVLNKWGYHLEDMFDFS